MQKKDGISENCAKSESLKALNWQTKEMLFVFFQCPVIKTKKDAKMSANLTNY